VTESAFHLLLQTISEHPWATNADAIAYNSLGIWNRATDQFEYSGANMIATVQGAQPTGPIDLAFVTAFKSGTAEGVEYGCLGNGCLLRYTLHPPYPGRRLIRSLSL
jgi:hypothetical protein